MHDGTCVGGVCICRPGFTGKVCQDLVSPCLLPCLHGGTCIDGTCFCFAGFTGPYCEEPDCIRPCLNGGTCNFGACVCPTGYEGVACELETCNPPCLNGGTCFQGNCVCPLHYSGLQCESRECWPLCQNGGVCLDGLCECPYGYLGQYCNIRLAGCEQRPCQNGGTCVNGTCICHASYSGPFCSIVAISLEGFNIHIYPNPNNDHMVGKTVGFICETNYTSTLENPQWYDQTDAPIFSKTEAPGSRIYYEPIAQNASYLIVRDLNADDRGRYVCAAGLTIRVAMTLVIYGKF
eukprot:XP_011681366.1 PREDICTED: fibropellin-3-like [Strongylocentrotus purpuratus]